MGAMLSGRWHSWQDRCSIGAMSSANVTAAAPLPAGWAPAAAGKPPENAATAAMAQAPLRSCRNPVMRVIVYSTLACT